VVIVDPLQLRHARTIPPAGQPVRLWPTRGCSVGLTPTTAVSSCPRSEIGRSGPVGGAAQSAAVGRWGATRPRPTAAAVGRRPGKQLAQLQAQLGSKGWAIRRRSLWGSLLRSPRPWNQGRPKRTRGQAALDTHAVPQAAGHPRPFSAAVRCGTIRIRRCSSDRLPGQRSAPLSAPTDQDR
jgi:hypothetical protein